MCRLHDCEDLILTRREGEVTANFRNSRWTEYEYEDLKKADGAQYGGYERERGKTCSSSVYRT